MPNGKTEEYNYLLEEELLGFYIDSGGRNRAKLKAIQSTINGCYRTSDHKGASVLVAQLAAWPKACCHSPGSRNAPLTIIIIRGGNHVVIDERSRFITPWA